MTEEMLGEESKLRASLTRQEFDKKAYLKEKREKEFQAQFRDPIDPTNSHSIHVPEILYVANKSENGFEGDLLGDFYSMFPGAAEELDKNGKPIEPIFISAEHGDGLPDLF